MPFRFKKTINLGSGLKLNLGGKSTSLRLGGRGFGITGGTSGVRVSAGLPGSGVSYTKKLGGKHSSGASHLFAWVAGLVLLIGVAAWFMLHTGT